MIPTAPPDPSPADFRVLVSILNAEPNRLRAYELATRIDFDNARRHRHLDRMERRDLIRRRKADSTARGVIVELLNDDTQVTSGWAKAALHCFHDPTIEPVGADGASDEAAVPAGGRMADLPEDWQLVREREGQSYQWPGTREHYSRYCVFIGTTRAEGAVHIGLGETIKTQ